MILFVGAWLCTCTTLVSGFYAVDQDKRDKAIVSLSVSACRMGGDRFSSLPKPHNS